MNNKKGFTLIEVLVVVSIVAVVSTTSIILFTKTLNSTEDQSTTNLIENIKLAADVYFSKNTYLIDELNEGEPGKTICTRIYKLQNEGLLDKNLTNPKTNQSITGTLCVYSTLDQNGNIRHSFYLN